MQLRTNNIAPTIVGYVLLVILAPVLLVGLYLVRVVHGKTASALQKGLWDMLDDLSHARLL
jgi:hypothetical protein